MPQTQNSIKNFFISAGLLTFIVSSGAFTIYQVIKARDYSNNNKTSSIVNSSSSIEKSIVDSAMQKTEIQKNTGEVTVTFDPYISGPNITGIVDKPENVQSLIIRFAEEGQPNNVLEFKPTIDAQKNFKIILDNNVKDAQYNVNYSIIDFNQKENVGRSVINVKMYPTNTTQSTSSSAEKMSKNTTESNLQSSGEQTPANQTSSSAQSSQAMTSRGENQNIDITSMAKISPDSVRTGGTNEILIFSAIVIAILSAFVSIKSKYFNPSMSTIFGNK